MITWNHEPYVAQAIDAILAQQGNFDFELIIGEDCSTDATREICARYAERDSRVRLVTSERNVGIHANFRRIWNAAQGRYVAFCEGDDYWSDPHKLAKQIAFLEARPDFTLVGGYTRKIRQAASGGWESVGRLGPGQVKERYSVADLIPNYSFHFSSVVVRRDRVSFPDWFAEQYCADRPLYLLCAEQGSVGFIPEEMSVYRLHPGGVWSPTSWMEKAQKGRVLFQTLDRHFAGRYARLIQRTLGGILWSYMAEALAAGDRVAGRKLFWMASWHFLRAGRFTLARHWGVAWVRLYLPGVYAHLKGIYQRVAA